MPLKITQEQEIKTCWKLEGDVKEELYEFANFLMLGNFPYRRRITGSLESRDYSFLLNSIEGNLTFIYLFENELEAWRQYEKLND